jgi:hypothetical protein
VFSTWLTKRVGGGGVVRTLWGAQGRSLNAVMQRLEGNWCQMWEQWLRVLLSAGSVFTVAASSHGISGCQQLSAACNCTSAPLAITARRQWLCVPLRDLAKLSRLLLARVKSLLIPVSGQFIMQNTSSDTSPFYIGTHITGSLV